MGKIFRSFLFGSDSGVEEIKKAEEKTAVLLRANKEHEDALKKEAEIEKLRVALEESTSKRADSEKQLEEIRAELKALKESTKEAVKEPLAQATENTIQPVVAKIKDSDTAMPQQILPDTNTLYYNTGNKRLMTGTEVANFNEKFKSFGNLSVQKVDRFRAYTSSGVAVETATLPASIKDLKPNNIYVDINSNSFLKKADYLELTSYTGKTGKFETVIRFLAIVKNESGNSLEVAMF